MNAGESVKQQTQIKKKEGYQHMFKLPIVAFTVMAQSMLAVAQSSTSTSTAAGTSTTTVETTAPTQNKFSFLYATAATNSFSKAREEGGAHTVNAMSLGYKYSDDWRFALTMTNDYMLPARGQEDKNATYRDVTVSAGTTYGSILGTEKTPVKYKMYLPSTQSSQDIKQAFAVGAEVSLGYDLTDKLSATALLIPLIYVRNGADQLRHILESEIRYSYTPAFSNFIGFQHDVKGMSSAQSLDKTAEYAALLAGVAYSPSKIIDLQVSVARERHLSVSHGKNASVEQDPNSQFSFLDDREISYIAEAVVRF